MYPRLKAAVMTAAKIGDPGYPLPVGPGCMLVRITCCTICGSDLHTWTGRKKIAGSDHPGS